MHHPTDRITHTTAFVTPVVEHWLEREIAQWAHLMKDRSDDPPHHERTLNLWATSRSLEGKHLKPMCWCGDGTCLSSWLSAWLLLGSLKPVWLMGGGGNPDNNLKYRNQYWAPMCFRTDHKTRYLQLYDYEVYWAPMCSPTDYKTRYLQLYVYEMYWAPMCFRTDHKTRYLQLYDYEVYLALRCSPTDHKTRYLQLYDYEVYLALRCSPTDYKTRYLQLYDYEVYWAPMCSPTDYKTRYLQLYDYEVYWALRCSPTEYKTRYLQIYEIYWAQVAIHRTQWYMTKLCQWAKENTNQEVTVMHVLVPSTRYRRLPGSRWWWAPLRYCSWIPPYCWPVPATSKLRRQCSQRRRKAHRSVQPLFGSRASRRCTDKQS